MPPQKALLAPQVPKSPIAPKKSKKTGLRSPQERIKLNADVIKTLNGAGIDVKNEEVGKVASLVVRNHEDEHAKQAVHKAIVSEFGQKRGSELYRRVRDLL